MAKAPNGYPRGLSSCTYPGGLGIPCIGSTVSLAQKARFKKLLNSKDTICSTITSQKSFQKIEHQENLPCRASGVAVISKSEAQQVWASKLRDSVDGKELKVGRVDKASHFWLQRPARVFPCLHLRGIPLRCGVLSTKVRGSRGRNCMTEDISCQGTCRECETLNHILQVCEVTHAARCAQHNRIMRQSEKFHRKKNLNMWMEPIIPAASSFIKPDLVIKTEWFWWCLATGWKKHGKLKWTNKVLHPTVKQS